MLVVQMLKKDKLFCLASRVVLSGFIQCLRESCFAVLHEATQHFQVLDGNEVHVIRRYERCPGVALLNPGKFILPHHPEEVSAVTQKGVLHCDDKQIVSPDTELYGVSAYGMKSGHSALCLVDRFQYR